MRRQYGHRNTVDIFLGYQEKFFHTNPNLPLSSTGKISHGQLSRTPGGYDYTM